MSDERIWFSPHGTTWEAETYVEALEAERDSLAVDLERLEAALREIRALPSDHDLLLNAVAKAMWYIASCALSQPEGTDGEERA